MALTDSMRNVSSIAASISLTKSTAKSFDQRSPVRFMSINNVSVSIFSSNKHQADTFGYVQRVLYQCPKLLQYSAVFFRKPHRDMSKFFISQMTNSPHRVALAL